LAASPQYDHRRSTTVRTEAAALQPRLHLGDHAGHARRAQRDGQHLQQLDDRYREE
jgi:hypothetical protein